MNYSCNHSLSPIFQEHCFNRAELLHLFAYKTSFLADAGLMGPLALVIAIWLFLSDWRVALRWSLALGFGAGMVFVSKLAWVLWYYVVPIVHFRMLSGHSMLAVAVWPVLFALVAEVTKSGDAERGRKLGLVLCILIGISRLYRAHTPAEILLGMAVGYWVQYQFYVAFYRIQPVLRAAPIAIFVLATVAVFQYGYFAQDGRWIWHLSRLIK